MKKKKSLIVAHGCRAGGGLFATLNLIRGLFNAAHEEEEFLLICPKGCGYEDLPLPAGSRRWIYEGSHSPVLRYLFEKIKLPKIVSDYDPDVIFGPGNIALTGSRVPQAVFIRNAYLYHGPDRYPEAPFMFKLRTWALRRQVNKTLPSTQLIFAQTPVVKTRFSEHWNYPSEKIKIIRFPSPAEISPQAECPVPQPLISLRDSFKFLVLTRYMPHRNPGILIPLCLQYASVLREKNIRFVTTIGPHEKGKALSFLNAVEQHGFQDIIVNVGQLNRQQVIQYYTHCDALWLHTLMETLCLPFLEAMTMGMPILAPDFDFSKYVCGDAALYYDPWDIQSLYEKIIRMRDDAELRKQLVVNGHREINMSDRFSSNWEQAAREVLDSLREIMNQ
jgi:glycosyltransferase involved in cell wall biosynthesis